MSVLIKGVHKSNCIGCICTDDNVEYCWAAKRYIPMEAEPEFCPMVDLPDHGDLIDRDALMEHKGSAYDIDGHELYAVGTGTILRMPVVIPAEGSEDVPV